MKVIGSGFGRTGTLSLKAALEQLGFDPCYHMEEVIIRPKHIQAWYDIGQGAEADWPAIFDEFQATVDFPASVYYKELLAVYPDAKVIHTVRDPDRWYESTKETIYYSQDLFPRWLETAVKRIGQFADLQRIIVWQHLFEGQFENRSRAIQIFNEFTADVKRTVPADQLLIFSVKDGWEPLCHFLDVPMPSTPFPHVNDRDSMKRRFAITRVLSVLVPIILIGLFILLLYGVFLLLS